MAKGFKVVTQPPTASQKPTEEPKTIVDKGREAIKGKSIVFCLPGRGVSYTYLKNFVQLCFDLVQNGANARYVSDKLCHRRV